MRILYLSQYFPPEAGATQSRAFEMAKNWVRMGHQLTMISEFPNHPSGIMAKTYRGKFVERSNLDGIDVIRVWVKTSPNKNFINRMLFYLTFMLNAVIAGLFMARGKYDLIYASSPPLFVGGAALALSFIKQIPLIFEVRDLWPESAIALGELSNRTVISFATRLENACYRRAKLVVVVTRGIYDRLVERGINSSKLAIIPNGANTDMFTFRSASRQQIRHELNLEGKFIAIYAGILGLAQGLETILESANLLRDNHKIHFLLIGDGPKKVELIDLAKKYNLTNVTFLPEKPTDQIPEYLSAADVALVPLRKVAVFKGVLPSKLFDAWACQRPILITIDGEARAIVEEIQGGIYVPPEEPTKIAEGLIELMNSPDRRDQMGLNGRNYTQATHSRVSLAEMLINILENRIHS
jgi:colanic acid biosynthesis glycosyl transferase WcaI